MYKSQNENVFFKRNYCKIKQMYFFIICITCVYAHNSVKYMYRIFSTIVTTFMNTYIKGNRYSSLKILIKCVYNKNLKGN